MAMTMRKLGPSLGTTSHALRLSLRSAGLMDAECNRPSRTAHALGCAHYVERIRPDGALRFAAWNRDALLAAAPSLSPCDDDVLRSFVSRWAAADAMRQAAVEIREARPALADAIAAIAADSTKETIGGLASAASRMAWARDVLLPARNALAAALALNPGVAVDAQLARLDGAIQWISSPVRSRVSKIEPVRQVGPGGIDRDARTYPDALSVGVDDAEISLLATGYTFNHLRARPDDGDLASTVLTSLSRMIDPDAPEALHLAAADQPMRATRMRGRMVVATIAALPGGALLASAHKADLTGRRLAVQTSVAAYALVGEGVDESDGDQAVVAWLREFVESQAGGRE